MVCPCVMTAEFYSQDDEADKKEDKEAEKADADKGEDEKAGKEEATKD